VEENHGQDRQAAQRVKTVSSAMIFDGGLGQEKGNLMRGSLILEQLGKHAGRVLAGQYLLHQLAHHAKS